MNRQKGTLVSKKYIVSLILVLCLLVLFFPAPVKAQNSPLIEECEPMHEVWVDGHSNSQPYIAAYMAADFIEYDPQSGNARAVRVTVSLSGTDKSVIQSDNWLEAGIAAQGPDSVHGGCNAIDWGYTSSLMLAPWMHPDPFVHVEVFQGNEWINCLPGYAECIYCWNAIIPGLTVDSSVTLTMEWTEDTLDYYAEVDGTTWLLNQYTPNETAIHCFKTGIQGRKYWEIPMPNTVKFLQFYGAWSNYNIGEVGWHSHLSYPGFIETGESSWTDVSLAYSTDGPNSYWDNTLGWGGDPYENVDANYYYKHVHFYPNGTTLEPDTLLWEDPRSLTISVNNAEGGTVDPAPGTHTHNYGSSVTVTAYPALEYGWWFNCWYLDGQKKLGQDVSWYNQITVTMDSDHTLQAYFSYGTPGGGCPTLFVWDGTDYESEGTLNIHADSDVTVQHEIQNILALEKGVYKLQLRELDNHTSHIDQVKLYAIDYEGEWHLCPLTYAYHNELGNIKHTLRFDDSNRVDLKPTETISLKFAQSISYDKTAQFTFEINGYNMKMP